MKDKSNATASINLEECTSLEILVNFIKKSYLLKLLSSWYIVFFSGEYRNFSLSVSSHTGKIVKQIEETQHPIDKYQVTSLESLFLSHRISRGLSTMSGIGVIVDKDRG